MNQPARKPALPLPEPLRALEQPSFTHASVVTRLPEIARRALAENDFAPQTAARLQALIDDIPNAPVRRLDIPLAPNAAAWEADAAPYLGMDWLAVPWFFAEEYFYIRVLEASGYFHPGAGKLLDPYARQKNLGLEANRASIDHLGDLVEHALSLDPAAHLDSFAGLLLSGLWGNQNDMSMWPVSKDGGAPAADHRHSGGVPPPQTAAPGDPAKNEFILVNDLPAMLGYLARRGLPLARVDFLLDNAGYELVADLAIVDFLLAARLAQEVTLHAKIYPVFVSDALPGDVAAALRWLAALPHPSVRALAARLQAALDDGRLRLTAHPFWVSPRPAWELPAGLAADLASSDLLISKGDANYRRLLGDLHWPLDAPFNRVVSYMPSAVLALRTCKSEIAVGVPAERVPAGPPDWIYNGHYGLVQFAPPQGTPAA